MNPNRLSETRQGLILPKQQGRRLLLLGGTAAVLFGLNTQLASADCDPVSGQPTCHGICPDRRLARIEFIGAEFDDANGNKTLDFASGERFVTVGATENPIMVKFWGCSQFFSSPDPRNSEAQIRKLVAYPGTNGLAIDIETNKPFVEVIVDGPVEDWEMGIDKETGERKPLALVRFQFSAWEKSDFKKMMTDRTTGKPIAYEGCAWLCPEGVVPTIARYDIGQPTNRDSVSRRKLRWEPEKMAQPTGNPRQAILTEDLK